MPRIPINQLIDDDEPIPTDRSSRRLGQSKPNHKSKRLAVHADSQESFNFTYHASRHERAWIERSLGNFYENRWIDDVLRLLKGGKEASVYLCAANPSTAVGESLAAKVYRPRMFRNLKNDHLYREGRANIDADGNEILDGGMQHAMDKRTTYGLELLHGSWIMHEYQTLQRLHAAGADVPAPYACGNNAILMEYFGDPGIPAPTLHTVELDAAEANRLFKRVLRNIALMLSQGRIHGDLSAYNILYREGEIKLIDFPQALHPDQNRNAYHIFERDITRVCEYFTRQGVAAKPSRIAAELWVAQGRSLRPDVHPRLLDDQDEAQEDEGR